MTGGIALPPPMPWNACGPVTVRTLDTLGKPPGGDRSSCNHGVPQGEEVIEGLVQRVMPHRLALARRRARPPDRPWHRGGPSRSFGAVRAHRFAQGGTVLADGGARHVVAVGRLCARDSARLARVDARRVLIPALLGHPQRGRPHPGLRRCRVIPVGGLDRGGGSRLADLRGQRQAIVACPLLRTRRVQASHASSSRFRATTAAAREPSRAERSTWRIALPVWGLPINAV